jgi:hypothetical protein
MKELNSLLKSNIYLTCPDPFEFLPELLSMVGHSNFNEYNLNKKLKARDEALNVIRILAELGILIVYEWYTMPELNNIKLSTKDMLMHLDKVWFKEAKEADFYNMVIFGSPNWYLEKTKDMGLTITTDWKIFVKKRIGDLEDWIEKNRPKESFNT